MKKLWEKGIAIDEHIERFTIGNDRQMDLYLAPYDVIGSKAHADMLASIGLLTPQENEQLQAALTTIAKQIEQGQFQIEPGVEDVHSQVELLLTRMLGDVGKKIHLGRSRNDQVLVDLRLYFRAELKHLSDAILDTAEILLDTAEKHKEVLMPGYTHTQIGMVSSFGLWFSAFGEAFIDDASYMQHIAKQISQNPLGTAAGYGSSIPLDRAMTTEALGFDAIGVNPINAQLQRGKTEMLVAHGLASAALSLNKLATDVCFFCSENYRFIRLPDRFTTGSSIMPHKKNPDVFELIRAHTHQLMDLSGLISRSVSNLISGYHRDFQLLKSQLIPAIELCKELLTLVCECVPEIEVIPPDMGHEKYQYLFSVELVNQYVLAGMPFRDAYQKVGKLIEEGHYQPPKDLDHTHIGSIGNLGIDILRSRIKHLRIT